MDEAKISFRIDEKYPEDDDEQIDIKMKDSLVKMGRGIYFTDRPWLSNTIFILIVILLVVLFVYIISLGDREWFDTNRFNRYLIAEAIFIFIFLALIFIFQKQFNHIRIFIVNGVLIAVIIFTFHFCRLMAMTYTFEDLDKGAPDETRLIILLLLILPLILSIISTFLFRIRNIFNYLLFIFSVLFIFLSVQYFGLRYIFGLGNPNYYALWLIPILFIFITALLLSFYYFIQRKDKTRIVIIIILFVLIFMFYHPYLKELSYSPSLDHDFDSNYYQTGHHVDWHLSPEDIEEMIGSWAFTNPVVDDENIYVSGTDHNIYCLKKSNAQKVWKFEPVHEYSFNKPVLHRDKLFFTSGNNIYCLDKESGKAIWIVDAETSMDYIGFYENQLFCGNYKLYCLDVLSGNVLWNITLDEHISVSNPVAYSGKIIITQSPGSIDCFNIKDGTHIWTRRFKYLPTLYGSIIDNRIFASVSGDGLYCLDMETGDTQWNYNRGFILNNPCTIFNDEVIVITEEIVHYLSIKDGIVLREYNGFNFNEPLFKPILIDEESLIYISKSLLQIISIKTGAILMSYNSGSRIGRDEVYVHGNDIFLTSNGFHYITNKGLLDDYKMYFSSSDIWYDPRPREYDIPPRSSPYLTSFKIMVHNNLGRGLNEGSFDIKVLLGSEVVINERGLSPSTDSINVFKWKELKDKGNYPMTVRIKVYRDNDLIDTQNKNFEFSINEKLRFCSSQAVSVD